MTSTFPINDILLEQYEVKYMRLVLFSLGPITIYSYGLMIAVGLIAGYILALWTAKKLHCNKKHMDNLLFTILISGFLSSKILYLLTNLSKFLEDPGFILDSLGGGWVVYGGILGGILGGYFYTRKHHLPFLRYFDWTMPSFALSQAFGRIGCFLAGCCYGCETTSHFSVVFPQGSLAPSGIPLVPTQLMSSAFDFCLCIFLVSLIRKKKWDGQIGCAYLIIYSFGRFIIEFFRGDLIRGSVGFLSTSQFISIFTFAMGLAIWFWKNKSVKSK